MEKSIEFLYSLAWIAVTRIDKNCQDLGHGGPLILRPLKADRKQAEYGIVHCEEAKSYSSHLLTRPKCSHVV